MRAMRRSALLPLRGSRVPARPRLGPFAAALACLVALAGCFDGRSDPRAPSTTSRGAEPAPAEHAAAPKSPASPTAPPLGLDLWVWEGEVAYDPAEQRRFFRVTDALGTKRAYVALDRKERARYLRPGNETLRDFLRACDRRGIGVELLLSENTWVHREKRGALHAALRDLTLFQESTRPGFAALHLDVEPHGLAAWKDPEQKPALVAGLVELVNDVRSRTMLPIIVDVPTWYERVPSGSTNLFDALLAAADGAAVMNYRTKTDAFLRGAATELDHGAASGKTVVIGVSAERNQSPKVGFHEWRDLATTVEAARAAWAESGRDPRIAVQSYRHVKRALGID